MKNKQVKTGAADLEGAEGAAVPTAILVETFAPSLHSII